MPAAVAAVNQLPFKVVNAVRIQAEATSYPGPARPLYSLIDGSIEAGVEDTSAHRQMIAFRRARSGRPRIPSVAVWRSRGVPGKQFE